MAVKALEDGRFRVQIDRQGCKRVRKIFKDRESAEKFELEYLEKFAGLRVTTPKKRVIGIKRSKDEDNRKLSELIELWSNYHGVNLSDYEKRRRCLDALCQALNDPIAAQLTAEDWVKFRHQRTISGTPEQIITPKTFNNHQGYLCAVFHRLKKLRVIDYQCPIIAVEPIKVQERQLSYLTTEQITHLFSTIKTGCDNPSTWWVAQICIRTGARWGEAEDLKLKHLHNNRVTFEFTKSKKTRTVPLDPVFFASLLEFAKGKSPETRLFSSCIGSFRRAIERAKLELPKGQCSHILRHSFASHFMMNGGNLFKLQKILGHSDIKMTMRYAHLAPGYLDEAVELNPLA